MSASYNRKNGSAPDFRQIQEDLKNGTLPNVILLYGTEEYLIRWVTEQITDRYVQEAVRMMDYTEMEGYRLTSAGGIIEACEILPMLSEKRVVRVADLNPKCEDLDLLSDFLSRVPDTTILIFSQEEKGRLGKGFGQALAKAGKAYDISRVDRRTLGGFIRKYLKQEGVAFEPEAVDALIEVSGYYDKESGRTLSNIRADVAKIAAHSSGTVTAGDVSEAVMPNEERDVFAFTDALTAGDKAKALRMLKVLLSYGGSEFNILGMICAQFEIMMLIRETAELGRPVSVLTKQLKFNEYRVRLLARPASRYSSGQLKEILKKAYEVDRNIKTGVMDAPLALELFVAGV